MLLHPATLLFYITLFTSVAITTSTNSWFVAWVGLEINLLAFIPLVVSKKNKYSVESALKYFLVQSLASIFIILSSATFIKQDLSLLMMAMLFLKMGVAPLHQWMPAMVDGLSWPVFTMLMTMQKMNPLVLTFFLFNTDYTYMFIILCITVSSFVGSLGGLTQTSLRKILGYSSIAHLGWMLTTLTMSSWVWLTYFIIYAFVLASVAFLFNHTQMATLNHISNMNKSYLSLIIGVSILSLGGLPPFTGFLGKLLVIQQLVFTPENFLLIPLLASAYLTLFFYARILLTSLILSAASANSINKRKETNSSLITVNLIGLLFPSVCMILM
uniref:NADH-ubiquinone oxidoreductase chain 2 n=1 Tax=Eulimnogammarus verrucosus TaxID=36941 RepID=V5QFH9_EULVE|nr:NADH dehydrogenase subunit 2 [Eulimnogammarus verrucosus]AHB14314.1 NADH dehydrogenase subunit 2 [Eulimnogammarus verrucosus]